MKKSALLMTALAGALLSSQQPFEADSIESKRINRQKNSKSSSSILTKKQVKARKRTKVGKQTRKANRKYA